MKIAVISLGCPKNQVDADVYCHALLARGHETTAELSEADIIIVNTCGFIESAKAESIDAILTACAEKKTHAVRVVVTGCLAERYREELAAELPEVDAVVGIGRNADLVEIVEQAERENNRQQCYGPKADLPLGGKRIISTPGHYAYLKISEGCDNHCYYCAIPNIRGPLRSRPLDDVLAEARWMAQEGVKEIVLVAQDITAYGDDRGCNQAAPLLRELDAIEGITWIRLLYAYPERITDDFIAAMAASHRVLHYLDMPIQHINDRVLKSMNRHGNRRTIEGAIARLRAAMPDIVLRTTLLVGYPGETQAEYDELCDFVRTARFDRLGCFAFSPEEGTVAEKLPGQIPEEIRRQRADGIMQLQAGIMAEKQAQRVGSLLTVMCDDYDPEEELFVCRSAADAPDIDALCYVHSEQTLEPGCLYQVRVEESDVYDLYGEMVAPV